MEEIAMSDTKTLELIDLGDALIETRQGAPFPALYWDNMYGRGAVPDDLD